MHALSAQQMEELRDGHLQGLDLTAAADFGGGAADVAAAAVGVGIAVDATAAVSGSVAWSAISVARAGRDCHGAIHPWWGLHSCKAWGPGGTAWGPLQLDQAHQSLLDQGLPFGARLG